MQTDEADPQWRQVMKTLGVDVSYALSPQAKGKVERPYRWLQDRIIKNRITDFAYSNHRNVHSLLNCLSRIDDGPIGEEVGKIAPPFSLFERYR